MDQLIQSVNQGGRPRKEYTGLAGTKRNLQTAQGKVFHVKDKKTGKPYAHILCECKCGKYSTPRVANFLSGNSQSCGHLKRESFKAFHRDKAAQVLPAVVEDLGDAFYPEGMLEYADRNHHRFTLAAMHGLALATFDFAMRNYRVMKGWVALKVKAVVKTTARTIAQLANDARIGCMCREYRKLISQPALKAKAKQYKSIAGKPPERSFVKDAIAYFYNNLHREGRMEEQAFTERVRGMVQDMRLYA